MKLLFIFLLFQSLAFSQILPGAKQIALSHSDVSLGNDVFTLFNNPALLSNIKFREVGVYYSPAPFGFNELANGFVAYHEPTNYGSFAIGGMTYGFDLYRESKISLGYSYAINENFKGGLSVNYSMLSITNYGNDGAFTLNLGGTAKVISNLFWGFSIHNFNRATFGSEEGQIPTIYQSGFSMIPVEQVQLHAAFEKDLKYNASFRFGINYDLIEYLTIRTGFSTEPSKFSGGIGINYSQFKFDYAVFHHNDLGLTHQIGLIISFPTE